MRALVTGGAGFIGHHLFEHLLFNTDWEIIIIDKLSYASNGFDRLRDTGNLNNKRLKFFCMDFNYPISWGIAKEIGEVDYILHLGAETHVDNSIKDAEPFVMSNVLGTMRMLDFARTQNKLKRFVYFSTDEVFGPADDDVSYKDNDRYDSRNPYAATKAGGEELAMSYANSHGVPVIVTHCMNAFGERQHPEKFIPLTIRKVLRGEKLLIYANDNGEAGKRSYIHCRNISAALLFLLDNSQIRDKYNIRGEQEVDNLALAQFISRVLGKDLIHEVVSFHCARPGCDWRYSLDGAKLYDMGFHLPKTFGSSLEKTIRWYVDNPTWLEW